MVNEVKLPKLPAPLLACAFNGEDGVYTPADMRDYAARAVEMDREGRRAAHQHQAVAYLDLGAGGYMDLGTDLSDEALARLPKGRHVLAIVGTFGVDGYTPAAPAQPLKPLTDAELVAAIEEAGFKTWDSRMWALKHAIESRHGITGSADGEGS